MYILKRNRETGLEEHLLLSGPTVRKTISTDSHRVYYLHITILCGIPVHCFFQIQNNGRFRFRKSIALNSATCRCRQFHIDSIIIQEDLIISGRCTFLLMRKLGMYPQRGFCFYVWQGYRHKRNIIQIACSCS